MYYRKYGLLIGEAFLGYAFETLKLHLGMIVSNDFNLSIEGPSSPSISHFAYLWCLTSGTLLTIFVAYLTDSYVGKFYISLSGIALGMLTGVCFIIREDFEILSSTPTILLIASVTTSSVRCALLIEQIRWGEKIQKIRFFIFLAVALQIAGRLLSHSIFFFAGYDKYNISIYISTTIIVVYFILMVYYCERLFRLDYIYIGIFTKVILGFYLAVKMKHLPEFFSNKARQVRSLSSTSTILKKKKVLIGKSNRLIAKECWGYRAITSEDPHEEKNIQENEETQKRVIMSILHKMASYSPIAPSRLEMQSFLIKYSVYQFKMLMFFLPIVIIRFTFSLLDHHVRMAAIGRAKILPEDKRYSFLNVPISVIFLSTDLVLLIIFELIVFPVLSKICNRDTWFTLIGYGLLIVAACVEFYAQLADFESFKPTFRNADLKFFNGLNKEVTITADWLAMSYAISPYKYISIEKVILKESVEKRFVTVNAGKKSLTSNFSIIITESTSTNYAIYPTTNKTFSLDENGQKTSYISNFFRNHFMTTYYVVSALTKDNTLLYANLTNDKHPNQFKMQPLHEHGRFNIETGSYSIELTLLNQNGITFTKVNKHLHVLPNRFYCLFLHHVNETISGKMFPIKKIVNPQLYSLAVIILLTGASNAFANVSFYILFYLESPSKLRGMAFSLPLVFNFFVSTIVNGWTPQYFKKPIVAPFIVIILIYLILYILFIYVIFKYSYKSEPYKQKDI